MNGIPALSRVVGSAVVVVAICLTLAQGQRPGGLVVTFFLASLLLGFGLLLFPEVVLSRLGHIKSVANANSWLNKTVAWILGAIILVPVIICMSGLVLFPLMKVSREIAMAESKEAKQKTFGSHIARYDLDLSKIEFSGKLPLHPQALYIDRYRMADKGEEPVYTNMIGAVQFGTPSEVLATSPTDVNVLVFVQYDGRSFGKYTNGANAIQPIWNVSIVNLETLSSVAQRSFEGGKPSERVIQGHPIGQGNRVLNPGKSGD